MTQMTQVSGSKDSGFEPKENHTLLVSWLSSLWHLLGVCSEPLLWLGGAVGHLQSWRLLIAALPLGLPCHPSVQAKVLLAMSIQGGIRGTHFLPEFWTVNFSSGTPNGPVTHEQRYFFGKLVSILSLHTSSHSVFPIHQVKYAVVSPDFLFFPGTKQAGLVLRAVSTRESHAALRTLLPTPSANSSPFSCLPSLKCLLFWTSRLGFCVHDSPTFPHTSFRWPQGGLHGGVCSHRRSFIEVSHGHNEVFYWRVPCCAVFRCKGGWGTVWLLVSHLQQCSW